MLFLSNHSVSDISVVRIFWDSIKEANLLRQLRQRVIQQRSPKQEEMGKIERNGQNSTNLKEDAVSKVLGAERNGRVRTFGKGVTQTRLTILSQMKGQFAELREENAQMKSQMSDTRNSFDEFKKSQVQNPATTEATPTTPLVSPSVTCHPQSDITKCKLLDWMGTGDIVAEGCWASSDPHSSAHCIPIGPNAMKVWVDVAKKPEEFLWRAPSDMTYIVDAVGSTVAWPADFVILDSSSPGKRRFTEQQAEEWWMENKDRLLKKYNQPAANSVSIGSSSVPTASDENDEATPSS